jgi:hypothetical protein
MLSQSLKPRIKSIHLRSLFKAHFPQQKTHDIGSAVSLYRSKFTDCIAGAVPNSYPKLDLLWDNVIAGPPSWPR